MSNNNLDKAPHWFREQDKLDAREGRAQWIWLMLVVLALLTLVLWVWG